jgi:hypothetical protein
MGILLLQTLSMFKSFAFPWPGVVEATLSMTVASTFDIDLVPRRVHAGYPFRAQMQV